MNAAVTRLTKMLEQNVQFCIPIYQRAYVWDTEQCRQLYEDIKEAGSTGTTNHHFMGAITCYNNSTPIGDVDRYQVIDGQQRIATLMLLLKALAKHSTDDEHAPGKINQLLFNMNEKKQSGNYHKMVLNANDDRALKDILWDGQTDKRGNIDLAYRHFCRWLAADRPDFSTIWTGIQKLTAVQILLTDKEDAQAIFESMNSTGLNLSQTDLVQNYLLMTNDSDKQKSAYERYWLPMEESFERDSKYFDEFLRTYLVMKTSKPITKKQLYRKFKKHAQALGKEQTLQSLHSASRPYANLVRLSEHGALKQEIAHIQDQDIAVANSLLLRVLLDLDSQKISAGDAKSTFRLLDSYLLRCGICGTSRNLNRAIPLLIPPQDAPARCKDIEKKIMKKQGNDRFPRDSTFIDKLIHKQLHAGDPACRYVLERLERQLGGKETADLPGLQIEHIMPKTLSNEWRDMLGDNCQDLYEKYLHTIGNLTLTGYNPELGNKPFGEKKKFYGDSHVEITKAIAKAEKWGEDEMAKRAESMAKHAANVWKCPSGYEQLEDDDEDLENDYLYDKEVGALWHCVKKKILSKCPGTIFHMTKHYGTIRARQNEVDRTTVVCSFEAKTRRLRVIYNVKASDGYMKKTNFVEDVSDKGHLGPGDFRSEITTDDDVEHLLDLVHMIWKKKASANSRDG